MCEIKKSKSSGLLGILILIVLSIGVSLFDWAGVRDYEFIDRNRNVSVYEYYAQLDLSTEEQQQDSLLKKIVNEAGWSNLFLLFSQSGVSAEIFFSGLTAICFFIIAMSIYRYTGNFLFVFFLFSPPVLDLLLSQQRNALAFTVFFYSVLHARGVRAILVYLAPFIHTIGLALIAIRLVVIKVFGRFFRRKYFLLALSVLFALGVALTIVYGRAILLGGAGDRRAGEYSVESNSMLYAFPWLMYAIYVSLFSNRMDQVSSMAVVLLLIFVFLVVFDFYGIRFLAMAIPFLICSLGFVKYRIAFISFFALHVFILFIIWLKI